MRKSLFLIALLFLATTSILWAQTTSKKIVLQGFWWDYWNGNYPNSWANYITELAPRLKTMGIDAVWIPPSYKNTGTNSVGYSPFDHYDIGDKYQKGSTTTRFGTKDEFLRMVAVLHANGIEVIQDIVLNHVDGAGNNDGSGGQDPESTYSTVTNGGYKNFRYTCWNTPYPHDGVNTASEYLTREGRWSKNYTNFHPHLGHNDHYDAWTSPYWGPDFCYGYQESGTGNGYGPSTNAIYNPTQADKYNRDQARQWILWFAKQTGVDGFRWDAVKHFPYFVQQDLSYNLKYLNGWASLGDKMFNVGEYVGGKSDLDNYVNLVKTSNGGSDELMGTFDFGLREAFYGIITSGGGYDIGSVPSAQQDRCVTYYSLSNTYVHRTVPFVNNHDTFRPTYDANGNYNGWNTGSELEPHIDPFDGRLPVVYAIALAVDGSPQIFFEDLFNVGGTSKRWTHLPTNATDLPVRSKLENIIWCHQNLNFKDGAYKVRYQSGDRLVIERSMKALIGVTDNWNDWQEFEVETDFPAGTILKDYSGNHGIDEEPVYSRDGKNYFWMKIAKVDGFGGYSIWAPVGTNNWYNPPRNTSTTQEWEMSGDLGDRNCNSLGQGGPLPANSTIQRLVGKIYVESGKIVTYNLYPELSSHDVTIGLYDLNGNLLSQSNAVGTVSGSYTATSTGWIAIKINNTTNTSPSQKAWVKVNYTAPQVVSTSSSLPTHTASIWTGLQNTDSEDCRNFETGVKPNATTDLIIPAWNDVNEISLTQHLTCKNLKVGNGRTLTIPVGKTLTIEADIEVNGTIVIESDNTGNGNLINKGNITGTGSIIVKRYIDGYKYHYIAAPNNVADIATLFTSENTFKILEFDEAYDEVDAEDWVNAWKDATNTMQAGKGYALASKINRTLSFTHTATNTGNISISVSNTNQGENSDGYNLVGNPYPSAIDALAFVNHNNAEIDGTIYFWEDADEDGIFETTDYAMWNTLGGVQGSPTGKTPNGYIAPAQAFFVHRSLTSPASGNISFNNSMRTTDPDMLFFKIRKSPIPYPGIRISASSLNSYNQLLIGFHPNATDTFDTAFDGLRFKAQNKAIFYAMQEDKGKYGIMGLPQSKLNLTNFEIPLGYYAPEGNLYTLQLDTTYSLNADYNIYVYDADKKHYSNLSKDKSYTFYTNSGNFETRFKLVLSTSTPSQLLEEEKISDPFTLYFDQGKLVVVSSGEIPENTFITFYNMQGQQIHASQAIKNKLTEIKTQNTDKIIMAVINWPNGNWVKKLVRE